ncbi:MAG TPA: LysR family transcriptional regulator [Pseudolabrys sp.]|nr:LysR family transcriptional regulator [Pseudolabrys sp.]
MEMQQIQYFVALCQERTFTRAAKRCGVAQPSVTNAIRSLERTLGAALFVRSSRSIKLTEFGEQIAPYFFSIWHSAEVIRLTAEHLSALSLAGASAGKEREALSA